MNGKCETFQEGKTSLFLCEPEVFDFFNWSLRLERILNSSSRFSSSKMFRSQTNKSELLGHS